MVSVEKKEYVAPQVWSETFHCEKGYASSDYNLTLISTVPDDPIGNTASTYEHENWIW